MNRTIALLITALLAIALVGSLREPATPYDLAVESAVHIEAGEGFGTGVFVADHLILTAAHVIEGETDILAFSPERSGGVVIGAPGHYKGGMRCTLVAADRAKDLALLRVEREGKPMLLADRSAKPGDPLFALGSSERAWFGFAGGHARQVYDTTEIFAKRELSARVVEVTLAVNMGDSGGMIVGADGKLVGICSFIDTSRVQAAMGIDIGEIRKFLEGVTP